MISAFGIDHGNVSKGLPSALRSQKSMTTYGSFRQELKAFGDKERALRAQGKTAMEGMYGKRHKNRTILNYARKHKGLKPAGNGARKGLINTGHKQDSLTKKPWWG